MCEANRAKPTPSFQLEEGPPRYGSCDGKHDTCCPKMVDTRNLTFWMVDMSTTGGSGYHIFRPTMRDTSVHFRPQTYDGMLEVAHAQQWGRTLQQTEELHGAAKIADEFPEAKESQVRVNSYIVTIVSSHQGPQNSSFPCWEGLSDVGDWQLVTGRGQGIGSTWGVWLGGSGVSGVLFLVCIYIYIIYIYKSMDLYYIYIW